MKTGKRLLVLLLVTVITVSSLSLTVFAGTGGKSSDDAIAWVKSLAATQAYLDYDGAYGAQCVDLIMYYYVYLGNSPASGNGEGYRSNALPAGWQRIQGAAPRKGDILVYGPSSSNPYGHVAIYESDYSTYHQNFNNHSYVERVTYRYDGLTNPYWGVIRPDFSSSAATMAWTEVAANPSQTDARISVKIIPSYSGNFGEIGVTLYNGLGNVVGSKKETADPSAHTYLNIWYDITAELGATLAAGHTYRYQYYAYFNGVKYTSDIYSFTTTGTAAHTYGSWSTKVAATCSKDGTQARTCSICGNEQTKTIAATGHSFGKWTQVKAPTATEKGVEERVCGICGAKESRSAGTPVIGGWVLDDGKWYYREDNGELVKNAWRKDSKGWCYLGADGAMLTNTWLQDSQGWCYIGADGYCVTNCWMWDGTGWRYLNSEGSMTKNTWVYDGGKWYFLDENGYMVTNQWRKDSKGWCYLGGDGAMKTNCWLQDSKGWCYIGADGYCETNCWKQDSHGWLYLDSEGSMTKDEWVLDGGNWYYLDKEGYMVTGTYVIDGAKYIFNSSGVWIG